MARAPRIEFAGGIYHVMSRGDHLEPIVHDEVDRQMFLKTLTETCVSSGWSVHSFVLMDNHYHLLIETHRPSLVKGMQYLNSTYTRRYNIRHKIHGHLFQGRYKALLVDAEAKGYFLTVSDYIHLNPVRAKKIGSLKDLLKDPWNSAGWLAGKRKERPNWLRWERVYGELSLNSWRGKARREYRSYLERRIGEVKGLEESWERVRRGWCFGAKNFIEEMKEKLKELEQRPRDQESWNDVAVEEMEQDRALRFMRKGITILGCRSIKDLDRWQRLLMARWLRHRTKASVKWLAGEMGLKTRGGMSNGIFLVGKQMGSKQKLMHQWSQLEKIRL